MKKFVGIVVVLSLLALAATAFAADQQGGKKKADEAALLCTGVVKSVTMSDDNKTLKSFVVTTPALPDKPATDVTITVTDKTKYMLGKNSATSADVKAGVRVVVRLTEPLKDNAGTAAVVRIVPANEHPVRHGKK